MVPGSAASATQENLLDTENLWTQPRPNDSENSLATLTLQVALMHAEV
jgi:hypothetical protein